MRVKFSGPFELLEKVEAAMAAADPASIKQSVRKREHTELDFGLQELADLIGSVPVQDLVDIAPILWAAGMAFWEKVAGKPAPAATEAPTRLTIDITTSL